MKSSAGITTLSGLRKTAITLLALGEDVAAEAFRLLTEEELRTLNREISKLETVSAEQAEDVLQELDEMAKAHDYLTSGGIEYTKRALTSAFGPDRARVAIERLMKSLGNEIPTFDPLRKADPQQVAKFIESEHPQTIALVLSLLNSSSAASMLMALPLEIRSDVAMRMANLDQISPEVVRRIAEILEQKLKAVGQFSRESYGGVPAVAEMFNRLESNSGQELLEKIEQRDAELGEAIRKRMLVFEDLVLIDSVGMREVLSRVDKNTLGIALKGTSGKLREHFFGSMSERGAAMLREDMEVLGPVRVREVEAAQQQIIAMVRALEAEGAVSLKGEVGEQYVV